MRQVFGRGERIALGQAQARLLDHAQWGTQPTHFKTPRQPCATDNEKGDNSEDENADAKWTLHAA